MVLLLIHYHLELVLVLVQIVEQLVDILVVNFLMILIFLLHIDYYAKNKIYVSILNDVHVIVYMMNMLNKLNKILLDNVLNDSMIIDKMLLFQLLQEE